MFQQFTALVIDPNPTGREFLWQIAYAESTFKKVKGVSKIETGLRMLTSGREYDVIFLSSTFGEENIGVFIKQAKQSPGGKEATYICVLKRAGQNTNNVAFGIIDGVDGFLFEPYSVTALKQVAEIATKIKKEYERQRKKAAVTLIVRKIITSLDTYALSQFLGKDMRQAKAAFVKEAVALKRLSDEDIEIYREVITELTEHAAPRPAIAYHGASERVKEKLKKQQAQERLKDLDS